MLNKLTELKNDVAQKKGMKISLEKQHKEEQKKFKEIGSKTLSNEDVMSGLYHEDPSRFEATMTDFVMGDVRGAKPLWANLDFLDEGDLF